MGVWTVACSGGSDPHARTDDARRLPVALDAVAADPSATAEHCGGLRTPAARGDCVLHGVERLARSDAPAAAELCGLLEGLDADECFFQVAERSRQPARCADAGRFAEDCRMHAWTVAVPKLGSPATPPDVWADRLTEAAADLGFAADDPRPWIAASRHLLGRSLPLDRGWCDGWAEAPRAACRQAGLGLLHDRINHARDSGKWTCGEPVPELLAVASDPELEAVLAERRSEVCP